MVRSPLRAARAVRGIQQGSLFHPDQRLPLVPGSVELEVAAVLAENAEAAERVLDRVRADGPLSALDFERQYGEMVDWFGVKTNVVRAVLEAYTTIGVLGLARRDGNRRYYDLIERLLPRKVLEEEVPLREQVRHKMLSRFARTACSAPRRRGRLSGLGPAKPDPGVPEHRGELPCGSSSSKMASSLPSRSKAYEGSASSSATRWTC